jgi:hypothetical protein
MSSTRSLDWPEPANREAHGPPEVPLPSWWPGRDPRETALDVFAWATSPPMRALAEMSGWPWPTGGPHDQLDALVDLSEAWDFRKSRERNFIERGRLAIAGRQIDESRVFVAARALGLVEGRRPPPGATHVVVLSGLARACINRTHYAAQLTAEEPVYVGVLTAHRPLGGDEPEHLAESGLHGLDDEADVAYAATRRAFELPDPDVEDSFIPEREDNEIRQRASSKQCSWHRNGEARRPLIEVITCPSAAPDVRRANTADQLRFWAEKSGIGPEARVVLVTTQIYVPYQHMAAIQILGLEYGCALVTVGVDARSSLLPIRTFGAADYLQEVRSALRAAQELSSAGVAPEEHQLGSPSDRESR